MAQYLPKLGWTDGKSIETERTLTCHMMDEINGNRRMTIE